MRKLKSVLTIAASLIVASGLASAQHAPEVYKVSLDTSKGAVVIEVHRDWSPTGADRFYELVKSGYYDGARFFRVLPNFMAQFGIAADPKVTAKWRESRINDDPVKQSNVRGMVTFAKTGAPNSRTTQMFINTANNARLDGDGFAPIGRVLSGMEAVDGLYSGYGEGAPSGRGPSQQLINTQGNAYLEKDFPQLDYIKKATVQ